MERSVAPSYRLASVLFLRLTALCFLIAFLSFWVQVDGLIGSSGILPVSRFLAAARQALGPERFHLLPTLCWLDSSDPMLHALCAAGVVASVLAFWGVARAISLGLCAELYVSPMCCLPSASQLIGPRRHWWAQGRFVPHGLSFMGFPPAIFQHKRGVVLVNLPT